MFQSLCQNRTFNNFTQSEINIYTKIRWMRILRTYFLHSGSEVEYGVFREQRSRAWSQRHSVPGLSGEPIVNSPVIVRVYADEFYVDISCYVRT